MRKRASVCTTWAELLALYKITGICVEGDYIPAGPIHESWLADGVLRERITHER